MMTAFSEFLDVPVESKTAVPGANRDGGKATDCKESKAVTTISGAHEEVSIYGTGIAHIPLVGKPEFAGLTRDDQGQPTATVKDGALTIETDDVDLLIAWRQAFQHAVSAMVIWRQRGELPAVPPQPAEPDYTAMDKRSAVIAGLRELATFLDRHPDVPVNPWQSLHYSAASDDSGIAEVDKISTVLGVRADQRSARSPHHVATRSFGPVAFHATACNVYPVESSEAAS